MTSRYLHLAREVWRSLDGHLAAAGGDLAGLPVARGCHVVHWWVTREADEDHLERFEADLWRPPLDQEADPRSPWSREAQMAGFDDLYQSLTGGVG